MLYGGETDLAVLKKAAQICWTQDSYGGDGYGNDKDKNDTIIYATRGTADESDDVQLMVLQDFTETMTMAMFDVVAAETV